MKNTKMKQSIAALAMAAVVAVSLLGYGCGSKSASTTGAGATGDFTGTAKGFGGDVTVTLTLTDGKITGCTAEGADETEGVGSKAIEQLPGEIAESGSIEVDGVSGATITSNAIKEAAAAAITAAGLKPEDFQTAVENNAEPAEDSTVDTDIVIVGAGGAGMTAALTATSEGKSVVIVESQSMVGGNSVRATGGMNAGKTVYQDENEFAEGAGVEKTLKAAAEKYADNETITALAATVAEQWAAYQANPIGYFDSVELMELDTMIGGKAINDFDLVKTLCENSAAGIDWLDTIGAQLHDVASFGGASVKRIHRPVDAEGKTISVGSYIVPVLESACEERGIEILFNTTATALRQDENGNVTVVHCTYDPETKSGSGFTGRKVKGTIHWVPAPYAVKAEVRLYENIIDEEKGVYNEDGSLNLNPNSLTVLKDCYIEPAIKDAKAYDSFQFVRQGFFCVDAKDSTPEAPVFNRIVSLKSSFKLPKAE